MLKHLRLLLSLVIGALLLFASGVESVTAQAVEDGCPTGTEASGVNLVFNGDFGIGAGPGPGIDPAAGFTSDVPNVGDGNYPPDTNIAVQTGSINFFGGVAQTDPFPGDPTYGVPGVNTFLYSNGNNTGGPYVYWRQTVNGLTPNTTYNIYSYSNNLVIPSMDVLDPIVEYLIDGVPTGIQLSVPESPDEWIRREIIFTTGPAQTSIVLAVQDSQIGINGDDLAITQISMQECLPITAGPALTIDKSVDNPAANVGDTVTYTYVVTNTGDVTLDPVSVTDDRLGPITLAVTSLAPTESTTGTATYTIQAGDLPLTNIATANGTPPTGPGVTDDDTVTIGAAPAPGLSVDKSVNRRRADVGDTVTYTYVVTNTGNVRLDPVTVTDDRLGPITLAQTALDPGESTTGTANYTIQAGDLPLTNVATASGVPPTGPAVDNQDTVTVREPQDATVDPTDVPQVVQAVGVRPQEIQATDPIISKSANPPFAQPGETVVWTITISNPGQVAINNIQMTDTVPAELAINFVNTTAGSATVSGQTINFSLDVLGPGASVTITVNTRVRDGVNTPYFATNQACLSTGACAQATLSSVEALPSTGQSPWSVWRLPLFTLLSGVAGWAIWRLLRSR
ncbi:MAG: DUF11 domain-containing protein [Anaerolineae bacterium]|nr:DUF11 domain-containing protein [Anaerolineae bacterium]